MKLLVIDDDTRLTSNLYYLFKNFYTVHIANLASSAVQKLYQNHYDIILLDLNLPDEDGLTLYKKIRSIDTHTPVVVLTGNTHPATKIRLLESGISDYISKPVHAKELRARIAIHVKRPTPVSSVGRIQIADLIVDTTTRQALHHGEPVALRGREYALLECLSLNISTIVSKELLKAYVWDNASTDTNNIHVHINHLRIKLNRYRIHIQTIYGKGYRLIAEK